MKRFNFRLQKIMEFRQHKEEAGERELALAKTELGREETKLLRLNHKRDGCRKEILKKNNSKVDVPEILVHYTYLSKLAKEISAQTIQVDKLKDNVEEKRRILLELFKEKKILEALRERDYASYRKDSEKKEQDQMDELASLARKKE
ncbi:MAG TPA: flagellar export protein FliJ [Candidatus Latescibacteria bacterium]|nr:flagellar export protein FliJ [Candidatus Latescibacterota bacterium]